MAANLNREQAAALVSLLTRHRGPVAIEGGPGGVRYVTLSSGADSVRYSISIYGEVREASA